MSQQILDMIMRMGGADAISAMAAKVGLSPEQAQQAMQEMLPAVASGMAGQVAAGNHDAVNAATEQAAAVTGSAAGDESVATGQSILGQIFGGGGAGAVAEAAAAKTGIDASKLSALLPMVTTLAASALGNGAGGAAAAAAPQAGGGIGGMLSGLLGGLGGGGAAGGTAGPGGAAGLLQMLDLNKDGNALDDIMGMAGSLFKR